MHASVAHPQGVPSRLCAIGNAYGLVLAKGPARPSTRAYAIARENDPQLPSSLANAWPRAASNALGASQDARSFRRLILCAPYEISSGTAETSQDGFFNSPSKPVNHFTEVNAPDASQKKRCVRTTWARTPPSPR